VAVALALLGACAAGPPAPRVLARGTLAYAVAATPGRLLSIELDERFALVVRSPDSPTPLARVDLGPPERDLPALAAAGDRAWVGGDDGRVRVIDVATGAVTEIWPVGAPVTALALAGDVVVIGDATGALCLRRARDGAVLQCAAIADGPIAHVDVRGGTLVASTGEATTSWLLPSLAPAGPARSRGPMWEGGEVVVSGRTVDLVTRDRRRRLAVMDGSVRAVAVLSDGRLAIAAWIAALANPSIIVLAPLD
jgi:hypothetical protein